MRKSLSIPGFLFLLAVFGMGCANTVVLQSPVNRARVQVVNAPGPKFAWYPSQPIDKQYLVDYRLQVSRDQVFDPSMTCVLDISTSTPGAVQFEIPPEKYWLPGGADYYWKVEGTVRDKEGEILEEMLCENPRSFYLEKRKTVSIDFALPQGPEVSAMKVQVSDEEFQSNFSFTMENGERRPVSISFTSAGTEVHVSGDVRVVAVNESTDYGKIIVDNLTVEELVKTSKDQVGDWWYELGGQKIVELKLGGRKE